MPALPRAYSTPLEAVDQHLASLREIADRLIRGNERMRLEELELRKSLLLRDECIAALRAQLEQKAEELAKLREELSR